MEGRTMSEIAGEPNVRFDVDRQAAGTINNIGGDQTFNVKGAGSGRVAIVGRCVWAAGLSVFFVGLGVLALVAVRTEHKVQPDWGNFTHPASYYVAGPWHAAVILLGAGLVVSRFGRV